jgi:hypothetical protein
MTLSKENCEHRWKKGADERETYSDLGSGDSVDGSRAVEVVNEDVALLLPHLEALLLQSLDEAFDSGLGHVVLVVRSGERAGSVDLQGKKDSGGDFGEKEKKGTHLP